MRRAIRFLVAPLVAVAAFVGLVATGTPALANHDNWNWQSYLPTDHSELNEYTDMTFYLADREGNSTGRPCAVNIWNKRPDAHSLRVQVVTRSTGVVINETVFTSVGSHEWSGIWFPEVTAAGHSWEYYVRAWWGDHGYDTREADFYYNWAGDTNYFDTWGTQSCPSP
jgi:hypothetical protein